MLIAQLLIALPHVRHFAQIEREPVRIERRTPQLALREGAAEQHQRVRLLAGITGALIRDVGGGGGALEEVGALAVVGRADLQDGARQAQPVAGFARRHRHDLRQGLHAGAEIALGKGGFRLAAQRCDRLCDLSGLGLDLGFEPDRAVCQVGSLEWLVGGKCGERDESDERGGKAGAD